QILDGVLGAVPRQSVRARSKWLKSPGPPAAGAGAATAAGTAAASEPATTAPTARTTNQDRARMGVKGRNPRPRTMAMPSVSRLPEQCRAFRYPAGRVK